MKKRNIKRTVIAALVLTGLTGAMALSAASSAEPGSDQDPIVTLSYVEKRIQDVLDSVNPRIVALEGQEPTVITQPVVETQPVETPVAASAYEVVFVEKGKFVYFGASSEVILRGGKANAIASVNGGLADLTVGRDIQTNEMIPDNHLILIARDDGRGLAIVEDAWLMIKGGYSVVE